jgi:hypothetical protein
MAIAWRDSGTRYGRFIFSRHRHRLLDVDLPPERDLDPAQWLIAQLLAIVGLDVGLLMEDAN